MADSVRVYHAVADASEYAGMPLLRECVFDQDGVVVRQRGRAIWHSSLCNGAKFKVEAVFSTSSGKLLGILVTGAAPTLAVGHNLLLRNSVPRACKVLLHLYLPHLRSCGVSETTLRTVEAEIRLVEVELSWFLPRANRRAVDQLFKRVVKHADIHRLKWQPAGLPHDATLYIRHPAGQVRMYRKLDQLRAQTRTPRHAAATAKLGAIVDKQLRVELVLNQAFLAARGLDKPANWHSTTNAELYENVLLKALRLERQPLVKAVKASALDWPPLSKVMLREYFAGTFVKGGFSAAAVSRFRKRARAELNLDIDIRWADHRQLPSRLARSFAHHRLFWEFDALEYPIFSKATVDAFLQKPYSLDTRVRGER